MLPGMEKKTGTLTWSCMQTGKDGVSDLRIGDKGSAIDIGNRVRDIHISHQFLRI